MKSSNEKIRLNFDQPTNGWTQMILEYEDFKLIETISNVPNDPIAELRVGLKNIIGNGKYANASIHLEPCWYYFDLKKENLDSFTLNIYFSKSDTKPKDFVKSISGNKNEILMPFYRALCKFYSYKFDNNHWQNIDPIKLKELKGLFKEKST